MDDACVREIFLCKYFRVAKAERAFIYGVKQGGVSLAKSIQNQDPARFVLAGFISDMAEIGNRYLMGVKVYPNNEDLIGVMRRLQADVLLVSPLKVEAIRNNQEMVDRLNQGEYKDLYDSCRPRVGREERLEPYPAEGGEYRGFTAP